MNDEPILEIVDLARVSLSPEDILLVRIKGNFTSDQARAFSDLLEAQIGNKVLVASQDLEFAVLARETAA